METGPSIVAVGASVGGLAACRSVLSGLPKAFPAAVLIAQHREAGAGSLLADLLGHETQLTVVEPDDKSPIHPGHVYVAPGNYHMLVERGGRNIALSTDAPVLFARPSIDVLFHSVAASVGPRSIAVVLTGASEDGAQGALAIKRAGGRLVVQTPETAESAVAPKATLALVRPDAVLDVETIPVLLCAWLMPSSRPV